MLQQPQFGDTHPQIHSQEVSQLSQAGLLTQPLTASSQFSQDSTYLSQNIDLQFDLSQDTSGIH